MELLGGIRVLISKSRYAKEYPKPPYTLQQLLYNVFLGILFNTYVVIDLI
jgi:hypothetical protein